MPGPLSVICRVSCPALRHALRGAHGTHRRPDRPPASPWYLFLHSYVRSSLRSIRVGRPVCSPLRWLQRAVRLRRLSERLQPVGMVSDRGNHPLLRHPGWRERQYQGCYPGRSDHDCVHPGVNSLPPWGARLSRRHSRSTRDRDRRGTRAFHPLSAPGAAAGAPLR